MSYKYILASASPRRRELLSRLGIPFEVHPSGEEETITQSDPAMIVEELSRQKALSCTRSLPEDDILVVIGADTIVAFQGNVLGKPKDEKDAAGTLRLLSGRTHQVFTGVTVCRGGRDPQYFTFHEKTDVTFYPLTEKEISAYVASGDPMDKAGSYGIQGIFAPYVREIRGDYNNVVGFPLARFYHEMKKRKLL